MELTERLTVFLDARAVQELTGGHQSRVFKVSPRQGRPMLAKVLDSSVVDRLEVDIRTDLIAALAAIHPPVCRPLPIRGRLVNDIAIDDSRLGLVTCYEFADGTQLDVSDSQDAALMGSALAHLHVAMNELPPAGLPLVAALRTGRPAPDQPLQLLHGDFSAGNLRRVDGVVRIFDLDDCGYGPVVFDVANALYMVLFDSFVDSDRDRYPKFKQAFVAGYCAAAARGLDERLVKEFVDRRVDALNGWLDDIETAPIGVRTATPEWRAVLRSFVADYCRDL